MARITTRIQFIGLILMVLLGNTTFADGRDTLFFYDFQDGNIPASWQNLDLDSAQPRNGLPNAWFPAIHNQSTFPGDTNHVLAATSWFTTPGRAENWLVLDSFTVQDANTFLHWKSAPFEGPVYMDGYRVMLGTGPAVPDSFSTELFRVAEGIGATASPGPGSVHTRFFGGKGLLQDWEVDLTPWLGQRIWIAFVHDSEDDNRIQLDDIGVWTHPGYDRAIVRGGFISNYLITPLPQVQSMDFYAVPQNVGTGNTVAGQMYGQVFLSGTSVYADTIGFAGMMPGVDDSSAFARNFIPVQVGAYEAVYSLRLDSLDECVENDVLMVPFEISDSVYARDNGQLNGEFSAGPAGGVLANKFDLWTTDTLTSVSIFLANPQIGDTLSIVVYGFSIAGPGNLIARSNPAVVMAGSQMGWWTQKLEGNGLALPVGNYLIGVEETPAGRTGLGTSTGKYVAEASWLRSGNVWQNARNLGARGPLMLRANFGIPGAAISVDNPFSEQASVYPNPSNGQFRIAFSAGFSARKVSIFTLEGKQIASQSQALPQRNWQIDVSELPAGTYFLQAQNRAGSTIYKRITIQR